MTKQEESRFDEMLDAQESRGPLLGAERKEYDRLTDKWEDDNPQATTLFAEFF